MITDGMRGLSRSALEPIQHSASHTMGTALFHGVKRPSVGVNHPHPSSAEVRERVKLHLYTLPGFHGLFLGDEIILKSVTVADVKYRAFVGASEKKNTIHGGGNPGR